MIGNFQNNGNLGNAANLDMVCLGRGVWRAVLLFIPYLWISKIHFDIHNSFLDIQKLIYGYSKIHFWISKNLLNIGYP